jgi:copper/silver efflux system protein
MKRIAAPMIGGMFTSFALKSLVYPGLYQVWKWHSDSKPDVGDAAAASIPQLQTVPARD